MSRIFINFLRIIGLIGMVFGLVLMPQTLIGASIFLVFGTSALIWAFILDCQNIEQARVTHRTEISHRITELTQQPWAPRQSLQISGNTFNKLVISTLLMSACVFIIHEEYENASCDWKLISFFALFFLYLSIIAVRSLSSLGKPVCELSKEGITLPIYGKIDWRHVDEIDLKTRMIGSKRVYFLELHLSKNPDALKTFHWTDRIAALFALGPIQRRILSIHLASCNEMPEVIAEVAMYLRQQANGAIDENSHTLLNIYEKAEELISEFREKHLAGEKNKQFDADMKKLDDDLKRIYSTGMKYEQFSSDMKNIQSGITNELEKFIQSKNH